ncbi:hypothetical protein [Chitinivorax sp. B]|uniref:hypothetical protein n=1 Tax=Chitinivorax sp. B TaxID=2502235 RepID=UPI0014859B07|nr:hypothetical protein [Chitinivorax sp. B]
MKHARIVLSLLLLGSILAGCKQQSGSYQIDNNSSFTLLRVKKYIWSKDWERWLLVSRMPDCQRKYPLLDESEFEEIKLYQVDEGLYEVKDGSVAYLADLNNCAMAEQPKRTKPTGTLIGTFSDPKKDRIPFVAKPAKGTPAE